MGPLSRFSPAVRERAVRMVEEHRETHASEWAAVQSVAPKLELPPRRCARWVRLAQRDAGHRPGLTTSERERLKELEREGSRAEAGRTTSWARRPRIVPKRARPPREMLVRFIQDHRAQYGVEPICTVLPIARTDTPRLVSALRPRDKRCFRH